MHILVALVIAVQVSFVVVKALKIADEVPVFRTLSVSLGLLLVVQFALGVGSYAGRFLSFDVLWEPNAIVAVTTAHVVTGALMFALGVIMTLWAFRLFGADWLPPADEIAPEGATA